MKKRFLLIITIALIIQSCQKEANYKVSVTITNHTIQPLLDVAVYSSYFETFDTCRIISLNENKTLSLDLESLSQYNSLFMLEYTHEIIKNDTTYIDSIQNSFDQYYGGNPKYHSYTIDFYTSIKTQEDSIVFKRE